MKIGICSFSFHRLLNEGKQDIFQYIQTCKELGCTHLQPWSAHFTRNSDKGSVLELGKNPGQSKISLDFEAPKDKETRKMPGRNAQNMLLLLILKLLSLINREMKPQ